MPITCVDNEIEARLESHCAALPYRPSKTRLLKTIARRASKYSTNRLNQWLNESVIDANIEMESNSVLTSAGDAATAATTSPQHPSPALPTTRETA